MIYLIRLSYLLCLLMAVSASAQSKQDFIQKLRKHYRHTQHISAFSLNHHFLNQQYRDQNYWDFKTPNRAMSIRTVEVDFARRHFYDNDILYFPGGLLFDRVQFQNDMESYYYEKTGVFLGKGVIKQGMNRFDIATRYLVMKLDFLAVRPLLSEQNIQQNIKLITDQKSATTTLIHHTNDNSIDYTFSNTPLRLLSINHRPLNGFFEYEDYQTTRGINYARVVHQYYDGATIPNYITYNDSFNIIERVDPNHLKLPQGYDVEMPRGDGILTAKKVGEDLYLVTDSAGLRNSLVKITGNDITLFGASSSERTARKVLTFVTDHFPTKKITSVHVSHPHGDEIAGLGLYADKNIEIWADEYTISGIKAYPKFAKNIDSFIFRAIKHEQEINEIQFYVLETMHAKRQSFAHFETAGIIFQSDFLHIPFDNTIAKVIPNYTRTFIDFIRTHKLKYHRIVGSYGNNAISLDVVNKTYGALM